MLWQNLRGIKYEQKRGEKSTKQTPQRQLVLENHQYTRCR